MKSEIRGLIAGDYLVEEGDLGEVGLEIYRDDQGVHIWNVDYEYDSYYHWCINELGEVVDFEYGAVSEMYGDV